MSDVTATVESVSEAFLKQRAGMKLCSDLMGGTSAMLAAGKEYIPLEAGEDAKSWEIRVNRTILFNVYKRTLRYLCGRVFEKPVSLESGADEAFLEFAENVDHMGRNLTVWGRHAFEAGLNSGVTFCLVDFSHVRTREAEGGLRQYQRADGTWADNTEAASRENGWSPYFIQVDAGNVLDARMEWRGGMPVVTHFRYMENVTEACGKWGTSAYQRIRAFYLDENGRPVWELWSNRAANGGTGSWFMEDSGILSIGVLPVAIFMPGEKTGDMTAEPALIDLAQLNKRHWQATCGQFELMEYVRRPPWFGKCLGTFDADAGRTKIIFGAGKLCHSTDLNASLQSIGVDPQSVAAGRQELEDLENRMAVFGLQLLQPKTGVITATESRRDAEENNSTLKAWALQFQDFLENCMMYAAKWRGLEDGPGVVVNTEFANALDISLLLEMYRNQAISRESLLALARNAGLLPDDFDIEEEFARIELEAKSGEGAGGVDSAGAHLADILRGDGEA